MKKLILLFVMFIAVLLSGCPNPDADKAVQEAVKVPGLDEAVLARDLALEIAIVASWRSDVELTQEQLAVEEVRAGKVRITGIVSREKLKTRAEAIAKGQKGVTDVISTITVDESLQENRINLDDF